MLRSRAEKTLGPSVAGRMLLVTLALVAIMWLPGQASEVLLPSTSFDQIGTGKVIVSASWGNAAGQVGLLKDPDFEPQGAMSFCVGKDASIYILDQINGRVQHFEASGKFVESLPVGSGQADNIAVSAAGAVYVLDSLFSRKVWQVGRDAKAVAANSWALPSLAGLTYATDLSVDGEDVWVEGGHAKSYPLVRAGKSLVEEAVLTGAASGRKAIGPGLARVGAAKRGTSQVALTLEGSALKDLVVTSKRDILSIEALGGDLQGRIYLGLLLYKEGPAPDYALLGSCFSVACLGADGALLGQVDMPETMYTESRRRLVIGDDGTIYQLQTDENGVRVVAWTVPGGGLAK